MGREAQVTRHPSVADQLRPAVRVAQRPWQILGTEPILRQAWESAWLAEPLRVLPEALARALVSSRTVVRFSFQAWPLSAHRASPAPATRRILAQPPAMPRIKMLRPALRPIR